MLDIQKIKVKIDEKSILNGVDLKIEAGEVVAVMGPNGSGKSTLAYTLAGHPRYVVEDDNEGKMFLDGEEITNLPANERAEKGLFLASQYPVGIQGLTMNSFLWQLYKKRNPEARKTTTIVAFRKWVEEQAQALDFNVELLNRGLNDGFSGGEKKKAEILQMLVFNPKYIILDELDSGLDVDALKKIAQTVAKVAKAKNIGVLAITHYNRILKYLEPDRVVIFEKGKIVREGDKSLAETIEKDGYKDEQN